MHGNADLVRTCDGSCSSTTATTAVWCRSPATGAPASTRTAGRAPSGCSTSRWRPRSRLPWREPADRLTWSPGRGGIVTGWDTAAGDEDPMSSNVAGWRASHVPGRWPVLMGPTSLVVLDPTTSIDLTAAVGEGRRQRVHGRPGDRAGRRRTGPESGPRRPVLVRQRDAVPGPRQRPTARSRHRRGRRGRRGDADLARGRPGRPGPARDRSRGRTGRHPWTAAGGRCRPGRGDPDRVGREPPP